jgi:hypothetical protein
LSPTRSRLPFETTHLRDHRDFPGLLVPRAPTDWVINTPSLLTSSCNGLCDRRIRPGHHDSRAQYNRVFIDCRALAIPVSNNLALSPFRTFQETIVPRLQDCKIVPGPDVNRCQRLLFVGSIPLSGSVVSSSNMHSDLLLDSNAGSRSVLMTEPPRSSALRQRLQILRFCCVRVLFWFVKHLFHVLRHTCLNLSTLIQRVVRAVHASEHKMLSKILIIGKRSRNDALRARRIKISLMRTFMRRHDFRVYYIRMHCIRTHMFPWVYRLRIRSTIFLVRANTWRHCLCCRLRWNILYTKYRLYHKLHVLYRNLRRTLNKVGVSFKNMAFEYSNTGHASMFQAQNIAIVDQKDAFDIFSREPPASFVYSTLPSGPARATQNLKRRSASKRRKNFGGGFIGYRAYRGEVLKCYIVNHSTLSTPIRDNDVYVLKKYGPQQEVYDDMEKFAGCVVAQVPVQILTEGMTVNDLKDMGKLHRVEQTSREIKEVNKSRFKNHHCHSCPTYYSLFILKDKAKHPPKTDPLPETKGVPTESYPPPPADDRLIKEIINGFCQDIRPDAFEEAGCGVCGQLNTLSNMKPLGETGANLNLLVGEGFTRCPRKSIKDPIEEIAGPIIDASCEFICTPCEDQLLNDKVPLNALAKGLWLGAIPPELSNLTFAEQMMIARIRHNRCLVRVSSGRAKMIANCIMFANPTAELYSVLPPSREELSEVLAFVFLGSARPSEEDLQRTPMLVRRNRVAKALEWLKLNHVDYADLNISKKNLDTYPISGMPVAIDYRQSNSEEGNKIPTAMSKFDTEIEEGTSEGPCPFTVHGLTGEEYSALSIAGLKIKALEHLDKNGITVGFRHEEKPESMYNNPQVYPQMFPWLFPYGLGGIGQPHLKFALSAKAHKRWLLMYHDKRFQTDLYFPMIAFNHEQMKSSSTRSFLLTKRRNFPSVAKQLLSLKPGVLEAISKRMASGEHVKPVTEDEKNCFAILDNIDIIGGSVKGSITSKKHMRNEIWSLVAFKGAPSWFITFSPADSKHPICLYYADKDIRFTHKLRSATERDMLVLSNPVAAARFFDYMVKMVIKHVLGVGETHPGLYGKTSAYYGTVEQQGRLTLHMHMMLWIEGAISPQKIRERLMSKDSQFEEALKRYLEAAHAGEFITGSKDDVREECATRAEAGNSELQENTTGANGISPSPLSTETTMKQQKELLSTDEITQTPPKYEDPTQTLPSPPPEHCNCVHDDDAGSIDCQRCTECDTWWGAFCSTVDDLLLRSNIHTCRQGRTAKTANERKKANAVKGCLNKDGICMARFPRELVEETYVDHSDGHIVMKKRERMMNTFSYALTYLLRCNTDVTSLLSGTSIKAVISYVSDYITKPTLKTHQIFSSAYDVFEKNSEMIGGNPDTQDAARRLLLKIVNALTAKMEIGSPLACLYMLDNPDHYTSHEFATCWWRNYVSEIMREGSNDVNGSIPSENTNIKNEGESDSDDDDMYVGSDFESTAAGAEHMDVDSDNESMSENLIGGGIEHSDTEVSDDEELGDDKVVLGLEDGKYVPKSYVDDYRFRPAQYEHYTLFRWIQCHRIKKRSAKSIRLFKERVENGQGFPIRGGTKFFPFLAEHPLYLTHEVTCDEFKEETIVPNFVGGSLPRADQGDREFYCATMLTIFKPWRNAGHLKGLDHSWDDAFTSCIFPFRESELIGNLNLRYECLDARDDFHAEMNKKVNEARRMRDLEESDSDSSDSDEDNYAEQGNICGMETVGKITRSRREQMDEMESLLKRVGWLLDGDREGRPDIPDMVCPETHRTPAMWKSEVDRMKKDAVRAKRENMDTNYSPTKRSTNAMNTTDKVQLIHANYFRQDFKAKKTEVASILNDVISSYKLNEAQERAFRIVAHHASTINPLQLKMFLNGMAGTGKTQVIKALIEMFKRKGESHRFMVLGPTGTSAALLNGSTYHSALGIRIKSSKETGMGDGNSTTVLADVTERLSGVDYIFLDEVSMVACHELYAISSRLSTVTKVYDLPFGGINMIFAGDFAQLPPTTGVSLYNNSVSGMLNVNMSVRQQENTIGKLLWQQVTTVVILKENMRQTQPGHADEMLRTALENMRYAACTDEDIAFLKTRVAGLKEGRVRLTENRFRNVSIITAYNSQKDKINAMGTMRFSRETREELYDFYSIDMLNGKSDAIKKRRKGKGSRPRKRKYVLNDFVQNQLWDAPPCTSDHIAGKLTLCKGLPIMIRNNDATELCITKGQEGICVGWDAIDGPHGKPVLQTLYVELVNPPQSVQFHGLPLNVVPIPRTTTDVTCRLPDDTEITVQREQVVVLPNFAMTDYSSQGKTRPNNVVDPGRCKNHQSYYTAFSRSSSAAGTVLVQSFSDKKITGGISGYLRQEFRELEILNTITRKAYEDRLPDSVKGRLRNILINSYQKTAEYEREGDLGWHPAIKWKPHETQLQSENQDGYWSEELNAAMAISNPEKKNNTKAKKELTNSLPENGSVPSVSKSEKAKGKKADITHQPQAKKLKSSGSVDPIAEDGPVGLNWDSENYSCGYDSFLTILYDVWRDNVSEISQFLSVYSDIMDMLCKNFVQVNRKMLTLEDARDHVRMLLHSADQDNFPMGKKGMSVSSLVKIFMGDTSFGSISNTCDVCGTARSVSLGGFHVFNYRGTKRMDMQSLIGAEGSQNVDRKWCGNCSQVVSITRKCFLDLIPFMIVLEPGEAIPNVQLRLSHNSGAIVYKLRGLIYWGNFHFVSRIVDKSGQVWFHDGISTRSSCEWERTIDLVSDTLWLMKAGSKKLCCCVYVLSSD